MPSYVLPLALAALAVVLPIVGRLLSNRFPALRRPVGVALSLLPDVLGVHEVLTARDTSPWEEDAYYIAGTILGFLDGHAAAPGDPEKTATVRAFLQAAADGLAPDAPPGALKRKILGVAVDFVLGRRELRQDAGHDDAPAEPPDPPPPPVAFAADVVPPPKKDGPEVDPNPTPRVDVNRGWFPHPSVALLVLVPLPFLGGCTAQERAELRDPSVQIHIEQEVAHIGKDACFALTMSEPAAGALCAVAETEADDLAQEQIRRHAVSLAAHLTAVRAGKDGGA